MTSISSAEEADRALAEQLQRRFDAELVASERQQRTDAFLALRLADSGVERLEETASVIDHQTTSRAKPVATLPAHIPDAARLKRPRAPHLSADGNHEEDGSVDGRRQRTRVACRYGDQCYRKQNPTHCQQYWHRGDSDLPVASNGGSSLNSSTISRVRGAAVRKPLKIAERLASAQPVSLFLTKVRSLRCTWHERLSLSLPELFDPSLGRLRVSLQVNFIVDVAWLMDAYAVYGHESLPLTVLCGQCVDDNYRPPKNVSVHRVQMPFAYGVHHTKLMMLEYASGVRLVVHTANLIEPDWTDKTQGVWVSPLLPPLESDGGGGDSVTGFRRDLLAYLRSYRLSCLQRWCELLHRHDFSQVLVFLVGSVPGKHPDSDCGAALWGHRRLADILRSQCPRTSINSYDRTPSSLSTPRQQLLVIQCSSIGSLGPDADSWLRSQLVASMTAQHTGSESPPAARQMEPSASKPTSAGSERRVAPVSRPLVRVIYPCERDVRNSVEGELLGGSSLAYRHSTHVRQPWLQQMMCRWSSEWRGRTGAMPHVKSYARLCVASDGQTGGREDARCSWLLVTSANLSKAAWGCVQKGGGGAGSHLFIRSYELGVLFLPGMFGVDSFDVEVAPSDGIVSGRHCSLSLPYSLPLVDYTRDDRPWFPDAPSSSARR